MVRRSNASVLSSSVNSSFGTLEMLETRVMMSSAVKTAAATTIKPIVHDLIAEVALPGREGVKMQRAGSTLFDGTTTITASKNGRRDTTSNLTEFAGFNLDLDGLRAKLATAPLESTVGANAAPITLALPTPDGKWARFYVVEAPMMDAASSAANPDIKTYRGVGVDDASASIRLDVTPLGFHAQVLSPNGTYYIDPYYVSDAKGLYSSCYQSKAKGLPGNTLNCLVDNNQELPNTHETQAAPFGSQLKTYRLAVGTSSNYTSFFGSSANAQAAIVTAANRVTGVYETEVGIRLSLVFNTGVLISQFSNSSNVINTSTSTMSGIIGVGSYDIGHVFTTGSGGVAFLGCVGSSSNKAGGTTGLPSPTGDGFYIDYVAHEMGHQFGANHTFNTSLDSNRSAAHAFEPGSGTSIMAYAGLEGADDLAGHSDAYFLADSIDAIRTFITSTIPAVGTASATGNNPPTVNAGLDYAIPAATPFALTASGSDPDGDALTYDWQERDLGAANNLSSADNGASPLFTAIAPKTSPTRNLPTLISILGGFTGTTAGGTAAGAGGQLGAGANSGNRSERLYTVARTSNWRVIARDNRVGGAGVASDDMVLTVVNTGASFAITTQNSAVAYSGNSAQTLTWNVAGTTANGINAANVKISFSTDGGNTFPTVLAASTPNDGSETITIPNTATTQGRIKVEAVGNIFFDINNANITVNAVVTPNGTWTGNGDGTNWSDANNWSNNTIPTASDDVVINVAANPTVVVSGARAAKSINSAEAMSITGSLSLTNASTFSAAVGVSGTLTLGGATTFSGATTLSAGGTLAGAGNASINNTLTWSGGSMSGAGNTTIANGATMSVNGAAGTRATTRPLIVNGTASLASGSNLLLSVGSISFGASGKLDLFDNDLRATATAKSSIEGFVATAYTGGTWTGASGIFSTTAKNNASNTTVLGVLSGAEFNSLNGSTFDGISPGASDVLVKYTYYGDVNFDGNTDGLDYIFIDNGFLTHATGWANGDVNYDGGTDGLDYIFIDNAFLAHGPQL